LKASGDSILRLPGGEGRLDLPREIAAGFPAAAVPFVHFSRGITSSILVGFRQLSFGNIPRITPKIFVNWRRFYSDNRIGETMACQKILSFEIISKLSRLGAAIGMIAMLAVPMAGAQEIPTTAPEKEGFLRERLVRLNAKFHAHVDEGRAAGIITLVARHGKIVHFDVYGKADIEAGKPMQANSLFRMYSMTKPVTSTALLMLYEEGKFQLDDPLDKYFPDFKDLKVYVSGSGDQMKVEPPKRKPTVRDILRHTGGFSYGFGQSSVDKLYQEAKVLDGGLKGLAPKLARIPLAYQPGTQWQYSVSHDLQAALVEVLSGMKFEDFVSTRILKTLDMKDSSLGVPALDISRLTTSYGVKEGKLVPSDKPETSSYKGVGGGSSLTSSARDYLRFAQMLANGGQLNGVRLLAPGTVRLMSSNHLPDGVWMGMGQPGVNTGTGYGLGVSVLVDPVRRGNLGSKGEWGWSGAAATHFIIDPEKDIVGIFLTQKMPDDRIFYNEFITMIYQAFME
jgi:CubicO group peptidase (beta-lactamase class C family)